MKYAADLTRNFEREQRAQALVALAVARDPRWSVDPLETLTFRGFGRYVSYAKAAIDAVTAADAGGSTRGRRGDRDDRSCRSRG